MEWSRGDKKMEKLVLDSSIVKWFSGEEKPMKH